jgi:hypothetical protein
MTETKHVRWEDNGYGGQCGYVGTMKPWAFQIWRPDPESEHSRLDSVLPGQFARCAWSDGTDLKAEAEEWLEEFVSSLGAVFPEDAYEFPDDGELLEVTWAAGRRVRFAHPDAGYPGEAEEAMKALTPGEVYTIAWADIGQSRTDLNLARDRKSVGRFNSVFFEPADDEAASTAAPTRED